MEYARQGPRLAAAYASALEVLLANRYDRELTEEVAALGAWLRSL